MKTIDPDLREEVIDFFNHFLNLSYNRSRKMRIWLKAFNLTPKDIIIESSSSSHFFSKKTEEKIEKEDKEIEEKEEESDLLNLKFISQHRDKLTRLQQRNFDKIYTSEKKNISTNLNGAILRPSLYREIIAWKKRVDYYLNQEEGIQK